MEFGLSVALLMTSLALAWWSLEHDQWIGALLVLPAAFGLVRLFIVQHDCGHGAFFRSGLANDWLGRAIGVLTLTAYDVWRRTHAAHHSTCGNLDRRGMGDVVTLTVGEYLARGRLRRLRYRIYRNPMVLFLFAPFFLFFVGYRIPVGLLGGGFWPWASSMATNAAIAVLAVMIILVFGASLYLLYLSAMTIAATIGIWLFYVQHQFEHTFWQRDQMWDFHEAALHGSSHYDLPRLLHWLTGNIGIHHIHHLNSRIPFYRLPKVVQEFPEFGKIGRLTFLESLGTVRLALWDAERLRLISFRQLRRDRRV